VLPADGFDDVCYELLVGHVDQFAVAQNTERKTVLLHPQHYDLKRVRPIPSEPLLNAASQEFPLAPGEAGRKNEPHVDVRSRPNEVKSGAEQVGPCNVREVREDGPDVIPQGHEVEPEEIATTLSGI
jgi:hypothetical protein